MTSRSRSANAFRRGAADAEEAHSAPVSARPANNAWSRSAQAGLTDRLHEARQEAEQARQAIYEGILEGTVPLRVPTDLIEDAVGSDRFGGEEPNDPTDAGDSARSAAEDAEEAGLAALRENIRARGQRMPIRIRPLDSAWRPDPTNPRDLGGQRFAVQSGRRRLQVCRELGIDVLAGLSFVPAGMERLDDLHERFLREHSSQAPDRVRAAPVDRADCQRDRRRNAGADGRDPRGVDCLPIARPRGADVPRGADREPRPCTRHEGRDRWSS